ncbi:hypothetical protein CEUSTIGMA_g7091.t1 [Chlamydomonas eustigma]|uniref:Protein phosphatase inhibitor 2 (IPP-2) n=1 Tax=Chlamydomonas eustigma TaxID=1157962 RepID=A0A250XA66_9CHLO|nr:hypothetical protein CEUSTIGMA_g7091.t1 [Chlamydomonas eustigma]|eukprot:GAX79650.1 hypothetical protein CEUSTIGMA_g7091.t1 [Chlamydomonas eustigma]
MGLQPEVPRTMSKKIVWDEENLAENERIKATLPQVKINEPKTPWNELLPEDGLDLPPLSLDGEDVAPIPSNCHELPQPLNSDPVVPMVVTAESPVDSSTMRQLTHLPESDRIDPNTRSSENSTRLSSNSSNTASCNKFESLRKSHYNMKSALTSKLEDEEEDEEDEEAATPADAVTPGDDEIPAMAIESDNKDMQH